MTVATLVVLTQGTCLYAQVARPIGYETHPYDYDGYWDDTLWTDTWLYEHLRGYTTLGLLARKADVIGVGLVSNREDDHFTITVDHAVAGCTNGASFVVYDGGEDGGSRAGRDAYMPTNNNRIVFAVHTNEYRGGSAQHFFDSVEIPYPPEKTYTEYRLSYLNRSWWFPERDDGVLFTQFTNVIRTIRVEQNWTNYFYLCRDGAFSTSNRVKEDSFWDMRGLAFHSTEEQAQFILDDPLVDPKHKAGILKEGWRFLTIDPAKIKPLIPLE